MQLYCLVVRYPSLALVAATCVVTAVPVAAQTISGRLVDDATGTGISGATVRLLSEEEPVDQTVTASDGRFELAAPEPGWYRLRAQRIGYAMATSPPLDLVASISLVVEFRLSVVPVPLPPIEILERQPAARPDHRLLRRGFTSAGTSTESRAPVSDTSWKERNWIALLSS